MAKAVTRCELLLVFAGAALGFASVGAEATPPLRSRDNPQRHIPSKAYSQGNYLVVGKREFSTSTGSSCPVLDGPKVERLQANAEPTPRNLWNINTKCKINNKSHA
jgi:hypothetical protein